MKRAVTLLIAAAIGLTAVRLSAQAQSALPTADQVLEKYITAVGGREAMEKVTSRVSTGTVEIPEMGAAGTITISEKAPNKSLAVFEIAGMGQVRQGSDGTAAWEDSPVSGVRDKSGTELADTLRGSILQFGIEAQDPLQDGRGQRQRSGRRQGCVRPWSARPRRARRTSSTSTRRPD
jgi:hypothetical protein